MTRPRPYDGQDSTVQPAVAAAGLPAMFPEFGSMPAGSPFTPLPYFSTEYLRGKLMTRLRYILHFLSTVVGNGDTTCRCPVGHEADRPGFPLSTDETRL